MLPRGAAHHGRMLVRRPPARAVLLTALLLLAGGALRATRAEEDSPAPAAAAPVATERATRHDVALRLRLLEEAVEESPGAFALRRRAVCAAVARATVGFFAGAYERALDALNEARATLRGEPFDARRAAVERVRVHLPPWRESPGRLGVPPAPARLQALGAPPPQNLVLRVRTADGRDLGARPWAAWREATLDVADSASSAPTRLDLRVEVASDAAGAPAFRSTWPCESATLGAGDVDRVRASAAAPLPKRLPPGSTPGLLATARRLQERLAEALAGRAGDTLPDLAADRAHLTLLLDRVAEGGPAPRRLLREDVPADSHRATAGGVRYRLIAPAPPSTGPGAAAERVPLVLALHGMGGSEDLFPEAYGAGAAVRLARARGWALACPQGWEGLLEVLDDVATLLPVDPARVYVIGHSRGAAAAWRLLLEAPERFAAAAALAGGWMSPERPDYARARDLPVLVVNGTLDPTRALAGLTAERAAQAGVRVTRHDAPDLDHLLVVGAELPRVFGFLDLHRRAPPAPEAPVSDPAAGPSPLPEIAPLWDFQDPAASEQRFRALLPRAESEGDLAYRATLRTQIARALGLQRRFEEAHAELDALAPLLTADSHLARARVALERGRLWNTGKEPARALPFFEQAFEAARVAGHDGLAVDALHMLGIAAPGEAGVTWNEKAMAYAEASPDPRAKAWLGALYNNLGWTFHERGEHARALELQRRNWRWHEERGRERETLIGKWAYARVLRSLGRHDEALALQQELRAAWEARGEPDGYVFEELGENLLALGRGDEARPHFARAHELLSKDAWLPKDEPQRLERLRTLGAPPAPGPR